MILLSLYEHVLGIARSVHVCPNEISAVVAVVYGARDWLATRGWWW